MSRKKKGQQCHNPHDIYWQSEAYNEWMYIIWRDFLLNVALSRFKWINLPPTCDPRFIELTLLYEGMVSLAFPKRNKNLILSTQCVMQGAPNIYYNPIKWRAYGLNGGHKVNFTCTNKNGVVIFDNANRSPIFPQIDMFARECADIMRTKQINRLHQKVPFIIKCKQTQVNDAVNLYKQIVGNEPAIIADESIDDMLQADKIDIAMPFLGAELNAEILNTLNLCFMMLGVPNLPFKLERQIEDEVNNQQAATEISLLSPLGQRRLAVDKFNARFGTDIEVVLNQDNISDNINFLSNLLDQVKYGVELADLREAENGGGDVTE